ncbi:MAG: NAD-binding protein [Thermoplasmatales archaeon]|nr:MAG: NAD-binding protein [Thermoplasmatales archaeon]
MRDVHIIIVGAGGIGVQLTKLLLEDKNHNIVVIEEDKEQCEEIARKFDVVAINADTTEEETLRESEIQKANALVATTDDDATNLMVCSLAKNMGVKCLVSVVNQEESKPMFAEKNVKMIRNPDNVMAGHLFKAIKHPNVEDYMSVGKNAEIIRLPIPSNSRLSGKKVAQVDFPKRSFIVSIERDDKLIFPTEDVELFKGDIVTLLVHVDQVDKVVNLFYESPLIVT